MKTFEFFYYFFSSERSSLDALHIKAFSQHEEIEQGTGVDPEAVSWLPCPIFQCLVPSKFIGTRHVKGGIRLAVSNDKIAHFSIDNYQKLLSKHPLRAKFAAPNPEKLDSFFLTDFDLYKALLSFPNGSAAGPDKIVPQIFKDLVSKSNGSAGLNFLKSLTKLINLTGDGKIPEPLRPFFFGAKLIALIKIDGGLRPIAIGNTLRRFASKCAGSKALS